MIRPCIEALARLSRQEVITSDDCRAMGAPGECYTMAAMSITRQAIEALHKDGVRTDAQLNAALAEATNEELAELMKRVETEMPNPFEWKEPTEPFCSYCDTRPDWWLTVTKDERQAKGYRFVRCDPEDGPGEWRYNGRTVICDKCLAEADDSINEPEPDDWDPDPGYDRYCLTMDLTRCLGFQGWAEPE